MTPLSIASIKTTVTRIRSKIPYFGILVAAFLVTNLFVYFDQVGPITRVNFFMKIVAMVAAIVCGYGLGVLFNKIRLWVMPAYVFTRGGIMSLLWIKLFWMYGPQTVGVLWGYGLGMEFVLGR